MVNFYLSCQPTEFVRPCHFNSYLTSRFRPRRSKSHKVLMTDRTFAIGPSYRQWFIRCLSDGWITRIPYRLWHYIRFRSQLLVHRNRPLLILRTQWFFFSPYLTFSYINNFHFQLPSKACHHLPGFLSKLTIE